MNPWQKQRAMSGWKHNGLLAWTKKEKAFISVVFSWMLDDAFQTAVWYKAEGYHVVAGGPAVKINPEYLAEVAEIETDYHDAIAQHNPNATFTSRGCIRHCSFCIVPQMEGDIVELSDWPIRPIVCDNNLLACSRAHFDQVIDRLKPLRGIDFNQGLDTRLLTSYHANRLAELDIKCIRLAWDHTRLEHQFMKAFHTLQKSGIPARKIHVYVLIGWNDTPGDALYRLSTIRDLKAWPNPMRYQPINAMRKNVYIGPSWTEFELKRFMRYWSNLRHLSKVLFDEFDLHNNSMPAKEQLMMFTKVVVE